MRDDPPIEKAHPRRVARVPSGLRKAFAALFAALALSACTTSMRPVHCEGGPYKCNELSGVKFCESEVVSAEGVDCASLGLVPAKRFCFVTQSTCVRTDYAVKGRDCRIREYRALREWRECEPGTPTFVGP